MMAVSALTILLFFISLPGFGAQAADAPDAPVIEERETLLGSLPEGESELIIHGFLSQGFLQSTENNFLPNSKNGTTDFAEAGLNFNKQLRYNLRAGLQLFARNFGRTGNYEAKFDWFLLDYRYRDWLGLRAGRIKLPFGLYNDTSDIDAARNSIFLPQSVYPISNRDYLLAQTGFEIYGFADLASAGSLEYRLYRGSIELDPSWIPGSGYEVANADVPYVHGGRLIWETPVKGLRLGASYQRLELNSDIYFPSLSKTVTGKLDVIMQVGSIEYTRPDFQLAAEYDKWWGDFQSSENTILVPASVVHERYYGRASVRLKEWLHPGVYYAVTYPNIEHKDAAKDFSKESVAFCRLDLTPNWIFKIEAHYIDGTSGLESSINDKRSVSDMPRRWQMYLAKTTVLF